MLFTGIMECETRQERENVLGRLKQVRNAKVIADDMTVIVDYEPADTENSREEEESIALLTDITQSVEVHGISITR